MTNEEARKAKLTVREACRRRVPLDGADSEALEHALTITERERDEARMAEGEFTEVAREQGWSEGVNCTPWEWMRNRGAELKVLETKLQKIKGWAEEEECECDLYEEGVTCVVCALRKLLVRKT